MDGCKLQSEVEWKNGVPVSRRFDDPYYSLKDGLAEARHVFLTGNGLPQRFVDGFHIAELGFGTGLNALASLSAWSGTGNFRFTSFEAFPIDPQDMAQALGTWPELEAEPLLGAWAKGARVIELGPMRLEVIVGDIRETLPKWGGAADAWFLDGFSPAKNPEMWTRDVLGEVGRHSTNGGTFATYTAASHVREKLTAAGFDVTRTAGFGRKRHMMVGKR